MNYILVDHMQNICIIIVILLCVNVIEVNVAESQAEYQLIYLDASGYPLPLRPKNC
mgnify:CR=1 FL=1